MNFWSFSFVCFIWHRFKSSCRWPDMSENCSITRFCLLAIFSNFSLSMVARNRLLGSAWSYKERFKQSFNPSSWTVLVLLRELTGYSPPRVDCSISNRSQRSVFPSSLRLFDLNEYANEHLQRFCIRCLICGNILGVKKVSAIQAISMWDHFLTQSDLWTLVDWR